MGSPKRKSGGSGVTSAGPGCVSLGGLHPGNVEAKGHKLTRLLFATVSWSISIHVAFVDSRVTWAFCQCLILTPTDMEPRPVP